MEPLSINISNAARHVAGQSEPIAEPRVIPKRGCHHTRRKMHDKIFFFAIPPFCTAKISLGWQFFETALFFSLAPALRLFFLPSLFKESVCRVASDDHGEIKLRQTLHSIGLHSQRSFAHHEDHLERYPSVSILPTRETPATSRRAGSSRCPANAGTFGKQSAPEGKASPSWRRTKG